MSRPSSRALSRSWIAWVIFLGGGLGWARAASLDYYLPEGGPYDERVPTPAAFFGFEVGDWHLRPDQIVSYLEAVAAAAPERARLARFGATYELRPLVQLVVATPERIADLETVRRQHLALSEPAATAPRDTAQAPAIVNLGYSIHGNEPSGSNASVLVAYWLVASESEAARAARRDLVVLLDPMLNPDGLARFANWANVHRGRELVADPMHWEHREPWPNGRTNHYWFDLNRDWFSLVHPESQARVARFLAWRPNLFNDHHEMGTDKTYFFQPGAANRNNPSTPEGVFQLQEKLAALHGEALDRIGSFYFTAEGYDDFYVGKGSVYPDLTGGVGMLFEQASARGHVQETPFGEITLAFAVRNHVVTSLSTLAGAVALRPELLAHQRAFYASAVKFAADSGRGGWVFGTAVDPARAWEFRRILAGHGIEVRALQHAVTKGERTYEPGQAWVVPAAQPQARLLAELFTTRTEFLDTAFYDISAWSVPLAFNLPWTELTAAEWRGVAGDVLALPARPTGQVVGARTGVRAYVVPAVGADVPRLLARLGQAGVVAQVATSAFASVPAGAREAVTFDRGAVVIPVTRQPQNAAKIEAVIDASLAHDALTIYALDHGMTPAGNDLGSPSWVNVTRGRVAMVVGRGLNVYDAGELWHTLDQRWGMPLVLLDRDDLAAADLARYDALIIVDGVFADWSDRAVTSVKSWIEAGGTLLAFGRATKWAGEKLGAKIAVVGSKDQDKVAGPATERVPFGDGEDIERAKKVPGTIFAAEVDLTHPLAYGLTSPTLPLFRLGDLVLEPSTSPYQTPLVYGAEPLLAGYASPEFLAKVANEAAAVVAPLGQGRVIAMTDDPVFRGYWFGAMRLVSNAIFFGPAMKTP